MAHQTPQTPQTLQTLSFEHTPSAHAVHVALFRSVRNAAFLQGQLLSRNAEFEYAFIDASVIVSPAHLCSAVFRALTGLVAGSLRTPNVHSEIVASLAMSNNIAEAYRRFGISADSQDLIVVKVTNSETVPTVDDVWAHLAKHVEGEAVALTEESIAGLADWQKVRKYYKLNGLAWLDALPEDRRKQESEMIILSSMALRGV